MTIIPLKISEYRIRLHARSRKTIMVEGKTDSEVLERFRLEINSANKDKVSHIADRPVIEDVTAIADPVLAGMGNKARALAIAQHIPYSEKFKILVDREWDGFEVDSAGQFTPIAEFKVDEVVCYTIGHSIENYFFAEQFAAAHLADNFARHFDNDLQELCSNCVSAALKVAFAYSWSLKEISSLERAANMLDWRHIVFANDTLALDLEAVEAALASRNVEAATITSFSTAYRATIHAIETNAIPSSVCRWLSHGHLAVEVLWCCIAAMSHHRGMSVAETQLMAYGEKDSKRRTCSRVLATLDNVERSPLHDLMLWATNSGVE